MSICFLLLNRDDGNDGNDDIVLLLLMMMTISTSMRMMIVRNIFYIPDDKVHGFNAWCIYYPCVVPMFIMDVAIETRILVEVQINHTHFCVIFHQGTL